MILPIFYGILSDEPSISLEVDANTLLWAILTGMIVIIAWFIRTYMDKTSRAIERLDERVDSLEVGQAKILTHLHID